MLSSNVLVRSYVKLREDDHDITERLRWRRRRRLGLNIRPVVTTQQRLDDAGPNRSFRRLVRGHHLRQPAPVPLTPNRIEREYDNQNEQSAKGCVAPQGEPAVSPARLIAPP